MKYLRDRLGTIFAFIMFFLVWEILARGELLSPLLFPKPSVIYAKLIDGMREGDYLQNTAISITRLVFGFIFGSGAGLLLGIFMGWSQKFRKFLDPIISAIHPIPKFSLLPIIIIAFGIGESSRIIMISIGAFFPMLINTMGGVLQINPIYYEVLEIYGANKFEVFKKVIFPGSLPFILTGARLSLKSSLTLTIGMEMVFGNSGLGTMLFRGWTALNLPYVYSILIIVSIIGISTNGVLQWAKTKMVPWHQEF